jgi:hypothetical protein
MKILLGNFNAKVGREDIFKLTIGNESLHEISNNNAVVTTVYCLMMALYAETCSALSYH